MDRIVTSFAPSVGLVVGTFAGPAHVHLHLETHRRLCPNIPILIHDDASHMADELAELCNQYGAEFICRASHGGHYMGDLSAFLSGLEWAQAHNIEYLVKFSRRFVPLKPWVEDLQDIAYGMQYATYNHPCISSDRGFRTECVAMHVKSWFDYGGVEKLKEAANTGQINQLFELFFHNIVRLVHEQNCDHNKHIERISPKCHDTAGYGDWPFMGPGRNYRIRTAMWYGAYTPEEFCKRAHELGLNQYTPDDFADPNKIESIESFYKSARSRRSDISEHLEMLARISSLCNHVTEFGVRSGNSTSALLFGKPEKVISYDINPFPLERSFKKSAERYGVHFEFFQRDVHSIEIEETDFLFIDDLHNYEHVAKDLQLHANRVRKYIGFHDTSTFGDVGESSSRGIWHAIVEFLKEHNEWELMQHYTHNNGLTILRRLSGW